MEILLLLVFFGRQDNRKIFQHDRGVYLFGDILEEEKTTFETILTRRTMNSYTGVK